MLLYRHPATLAQCSSAPAQVRARSPSWRVVILLIVVYILCLLGGIGPEKK